MQSSPSAHTHTHTYNFFPSYHFRQLIQSDRLEDSYWNFCMSLQHSNCTWCSIEGPKMLSCWSHHSMSSPALALLSCILLWKVNSLLLKQYVLILVPFHQGWNFDNYKLCASNPDWPWLCHLYPRIAVKYSCEAVHLMIKEFPSLWISTTNVWPTCIIAISYKRIKDWLWTLTLHSSSLRQGTLSISNLCISLTV